jgi:hypothetical protein
MRKTFACIATMAVLSAAALSADTFKGRISDAMCKAMHKDGEHGTKKMTDRECVEGCVKGGEKYVFVGEGDKVYSIANQDLAALKTHAGHEVVVTGTAKGDTLTISKIDMPAKK